ncbi:MAG: PAS domain S-box protein [Cytophagaceae bacterium]|jgi:PAS domain S-box-containing protein|nr:PAS domain S-box protein [Cytophagaceae bacterium]
MKLRFSARACLLLVGLGFLIWKLPMTPAMLVLIGLLFLVVFSMFVVRPPHLDLSKSTSASEKSESKNVKNNLHENEDSSKEYYATWLSEFNLFINSQETIEDLFRGYFSRATEISHAHYGISLVKPEVLYQKNDRLLIAGGYGVFHQFMDEYEFDGISDQTIKQGTETLIHPVPDDFFPIESGLGKRNPKYLWIVPLNAYGQILGLVELAFFSEPKEELKELLRQSITLLAVRMQNILLRIRSEELLKETQLHSKQLEESLEELKNKEAKLAESSAKIRSYQSMLISILNEIPMKVFLKKPDGKFFAVNQAVSKFHDMDAEELIGKSDFDLYPKEQAQIWFDEEQTIIKNGKREFITEDGSKFLQTVKMPFFIAPINQIGLLGYQMDITEIEKYKRGIK